MCSITKSELIQNLSLKIDEIEEPILEESVRLLLALIMETLRANERVEIRGFGSFCIHKREARIGRNPKTGEPIYICVKSVPFFRAGKRLRDEVNDGQALAELS